MRIRRIAKMFFIVELINVNDVKENDYLKSVEQRAYDAIGLAYDEFKEKGYITSYPILVGILDDAIALHSKKHGMIIQNKAIYFKNDALEHIWRDSKVNSGIAVSKEDVQNFPFAKSDMSIYYDSETKRYTYTDMINKFVLETNVKIKLDNGKKEVVTLVTASKLRGVDEFEMRKYTKIK